MLGGLNVATSKRIFVLIRVDLDSHQVTWSTCNFENSIKTLRFRMFGIGMVRQQIGMQKFLISFLPRDIIMLQSKSII